MRLNYRASKRHLASIILVAITILPFACAADNTQKQQSASAIESGQISAANENAVVVAGAEGAGQESTSGTSAPYSVECGQMNDHGDSFCYVDADTYVGWRTYHSFCLRCHAQDAVGSTFAPSLLERVEKMDRDRFVARLNDGFTGQVGVMPPWKDDPNVRKRFNELYAYLKARSSGDLPPGRPKKKPKSN